VKLFKCAWFDEKDYFEFFPLEGIKAKEARHLMGEGLTFEFRNVYR
jgi:hypothetical protein